MSWNSHGDIAQPGDLVELVGLGHKHFIFRLDTGGEFQTHKGVLKHDEMIGKQWGCQITSHLGTPFFMVQPALGDLLETLPRNSQIMYPKEIGFILMTMGIAPGMRVIEAGTGSGSLTIALTNVIGTEGRVYSYEVREDMQRLAIKNLDRFGLSDRVDFKLRNIVEGFEETGVDAVFLDLPNPSDFIPQVRDALKPGGYFGSIQPTANQVSMLINALRQNRFAFIDVCEVLLRYYKPEPNRFRPVDRMIAHTGYLIFARPVTIDPMRDSLDQKLMKQIGLFGADAKDDQESGE